MPGYVTSALKAAVPKAIESNEDSRNQSIAAIAGGRKRFSIFPILGIDQRFFAGTIPRVTAFMGLTQEVRSHAFGDTSFLDLPAAQRKGGRDLEQGLSPELVAENLIPPLATIPARVRNATQLPGMAAARVHWASRQIKIRLQSNSSMHFSCIFRNLICRNTAAGETGRAFEARCD